MPITPNFPLWSPDDSDDWDLTIDLAAMQVSVDSALSVIERAPLSLDMTNAERLAIIAPQLRRGLVVYATDTKIEWRYDGSAWRFNTYTQTARVGTTILTTNALTTAVSLTLPAEAPGGTYLVYYTIVTDAGSVNSRFFKVSWDATQLTDYSNDHISQAPIGGQSTSDTLTKVGHTGGAANVTLQVQVNASGPIFRYARLTVQHVTH